MYRAQSAGGTAWYVLESDGFAPITEIQGWLLLAQPETKTLAYRGLAKAGPLSTDLSTVNRTTSSQHAITAGLPTAKPQLHPLEPH